MKTGVIVILSAKAEGSDRVLGLEAGADDYLVKPFVNARFQAALDKFIAQRNAFQDLSSLNQQNIDFIMESAHRRGAELYPKGIQDRTLEIICNYLKNAAGVELTSEEIADKVGLSRVTVRRYMNHLLEKGDITGRMNYETGGRPCMVSQWKR